VTDPFPQDQVVFEGKGVVLAEDEGRDIAQALGGKKAVLLRNHGLLTVGETIEEVSKSAYLRLPCLSHTCSKRPSCGSTH
jgi:ribulose-5-phosphate 4-epimerase/fuculose-1-phosphate aldolase